MGVGDGSLFVAAPAGRRNALRLAAEAKSLIAERRERPVSVGEVKLMKV